MGIFSARKTSFTLGLFGLLALLASLAGCPRPNPNDETARPAKDSFFSWGPNSANSLTGPRHRGTITDRAGTLLAYTEKNWAVSARPEALPPFGQWVPSMARILHLPKEALMKELAGAKTSVWTKNGLSASQAADIDALDIKGLEVLPGFEREYPMGVSTSPVLGVLDQNGRGIAGAEFAHDPVLTGAASSDGRPGDLVLTLERGVQMEAHDALADIARHYQAQKGCFIVMDLQKGQILALASFPSWAPADFWKRDPADLVDHALDAYANPVQIISLLGWLSQDTNSTETPSGAWQWESAPGGPDFWSPWDAATLAGLMARDVPLSDLWSLGFGQLTGVDLPGENAGQLPPTPSGFLGGYPYPGFKATPMQLLRALAVLMTGGRNIQPHLTSTPSPAEVAADAGPSPSSPSLSLPSLPEGWSDRLQKLLGAQQRGPLLASVVASPGAAGNFQMTALGVWPTRSPKVGYILIVDGVRIDPEKKRMFWGQILKVAERAARLPLDPCVGVACTHPRDAERGPRVSPKTASGKVASPSPKNRAMEVNLGRAS